MAFIDWSPFLVVAESPCALLDIVDRRQEPNTLHAPRVHSQFIIVIITVQLTIHSAHAYNVNKRHFQ